MLKYLLVATCAVFYLSSAKAQYTKSELQNMYGDMLSDEGINNEVDSDGDIAFSYKDLDMFIIINDSDQEFFRLAVIDIHEVKNDADRIRVRGIINDINSNLKVVKAYVTGNRVWLAVEMFTERPRDVVPVLMRSLDVMVQAYEQFRKDYARKKS